MIHNHVTSGVHFNVLALCGAELHDSYNYAASMPVSI